VHLDLVPAAPVHANELGRICYEAFKDVSDAHGFRTSFASAGIARGLLSLMIERSEFYGVAALLDGDLVGSNFLSIMDEVAGIGPITVEVPHQGRGIGRALMEDVMQYATAHNIARVRLFQEAFNMASLSLYASLGFQVRDAAAVLEARPADHPDVSVRQACADDLDSIEALGRKIYKVGRRHEVGLTIELGFGTLVRERRDRIVGYFTPGLFGHGVAETEEDAVALVGDAARRSSAGDSRFFCPLSQSGLYRRLLQSGCRTLEVMNMMTLGPYDPPDATWLPSVLY